MRKNQTEAPTPRRHQLFTAHSHSGRSHSQYLRPKKSAQQAVAILTHTLRNSRTHPGHGACSRRRQHRRNAWPTIIISGGLPCWPVPSCDGRRRLVGCRDSLRGPSVLLPAAAALVLTGPRSILRPLHGNALGAEMAPIRRSDDQSAASKLGIKAHWRPPARRCGAVSGTGDDGNPTGFQSFVSLRVVMATTGEIFVRHE